MKNTKISQSLLKSLFNYKTGNECGIRIYEHYVNGVELQSSDAMAMGNWFEYRCTGQLPRNGIIPEPERLKNGELSIAYKRLEKQVENYEKIIKTYDIKILETGVAFEHNLGSGIIDILAEWDGQKVIIDLKTTARIDDKWTEFGWGDEKFDFSDSPNAQYLTIQAVQYKLLAREQWGIKDIPFYFFVFSTTDDSAVKIFRVLVDPERLDKHLSQIEYAYRYFNDSFITKSKKILAIPELKRCNQCVLNQNCEHKVEVPLIKEIQVS